MPLSFSLMMLGVFVAGVRTGSRDADRDLPPLAEEAAMDGDDRLAARLLGLAMPVGLAFADDARHRRRVAGRGRLLDGRGHLAAPTRRCTRRSSCCNRRCSSPSPVRSAS